jgi:hypothetical protein
MEPERYAELLLLHDGAAAARSIVEGLLEDGGDAVAVAELETAVEPLRTISRVPYGGAVVGGRGIPLATFGPQGAQAAMQEFRSGSIVVDFSGEERDDLDRVIGGMVVVELEEPDEAGSELLRFEESRVLAAYHAEWGIATVPGCGGVLARLDLEFREPRRVSMRLLFDVASHQWALRAMELTGRCLVTIRIGELTERRIRVRTPRSAQLTSALSVSRLLDQVPIFEEV